MSRTSDEYEWNGEISNNPCEFHDYVDYNIICKDYSIIFQPAMLWLPSLSKLMPTFTIGLP